MSNLILAVTSVGTTLSAVYFLIVEPVLSSPNVQLVWQFLK